MLVDFAIASANIDDREVLSPARGEGQLSGYSRRQEESLDTEGTRLLATRCRNQKQQYSEAFRRLHTRMRRRVETTTGQLTEQFGVSRVRGRIHWDIRTRMSNKFGACLLGCFLNRALGGPLMALKNLIFA